MNNLIIDKYTNIEECLLVKISYSIKVLKSYNELTMYRLYQNLKEEFDNLSDIDLIEILDVLFLFDLIKYDVKQDLIRIKKDENY